jgi:transcriptional regulator with XRE-family HTH domain
MSDALPQDVISRCVDGATPVRAWREHLRLTQQEVATRLGIVESTYARWETRRRLRKAMENKIAAALGIDVSLLDFEESIWPNIWRKTSPSILPTKD